MGFDIMFRFTKRRVAPGYLLFVGRTRRITQCLTPSFVAQVVKLSHRGYLRLWNVGKRCVFYRHKSASKSEAREVQTPSPTQSKKRKTQPSLVGQLSFLVAEMGFEPHDLRVMSPASYQTAPLRDIKLLSFSV